MARKHPGTSGVVLDLTPEVPGFIQRQIQRQLKHRTARTSPVEQLDGLEDA